MKISKIVSIILLAFIVFSAFIPFAQAVTFNGSSKVNFPGVQGVGEYFGNNIDGKEIWITQKNQRINDITSMVCLEDGPENSCLTYLMNITQFFVIDLKEKYFSDSGKSMGGIALNSGGPRINLRFYFSDKNENGEKGENDLYFNYEFGETKLNAKKSKGNLVKISRNQKCGTEDPNICVIGLNTFITYSAKGPTRGVYWTYSDITVYSDENDNIRVHRSHKDKSDGKQVGFFQHILQDIAQYKGGYGARLGDIEHGTEILISEKGKDNKGELIRLVVDKNYGRFVKSEFPFMAPKENREPLPLSWANGATLGQANFQIYEKSRVLIPLMNEYLWDSHSQVDKDTKLNVFYTLRDVFKFKGINASEHNGTSANPRNHDGYKDDDGYLICGTADIGCYIKNLGISIGKFLGNIWNGFADVIKGIFTWLFETIKNFIWPYIEPFWTNIGKPVFDFFYGFFKPIWEFAIGKINYQSLVWGNQDYICSKTTGFYIDVETPASLRPSELLGFFLLLANPIPPEDQSNICTNIGVKKLNYGKSTIIDTTVFLFFVISGFWFLFYIVRK